MLKVLVKILNQNQYKNFWRDADVNEIGLIKENDHVALFSNDYMFFIALSISLFRGGPCNFSTLKPAACIVLRTSPLLQ